MQWIGIVGASAPLICMVVLVFIAFVQGLFRPRGKACRTRRTGAGYALGAALLCFSMFYHPRLELAANAQMQRDEQGDADDNGDPESPIRHLLRQLRRIRRGERVDRLMWRPE